MHPRIDFFPHPSCQTLYHKAVNPDMDEGEMIDKKNKNPVYKI